MLGTNPGIFFLEAITELVSPAGSEACLIAAVQNGADAVYLGGGAYNARRSAANFDESSLVKALDYCHARNVKVYVTLNTLIFDREMREALDFAAFLYKNGADAAIVQDIGLASQIAKHIPELRLHASTQMGIHTIEGLNICKSIGISLAVLSRELCLEEIKKMCLQSELDIEVFAHGAMCMSFSGNCLYSSMVGERSGNRGTCAQPCRKNAYIELDGVKRERPAYALSLSDLCLLNEVNCLKDAGVHSIKLEGRMKRAEYVAVATAAYRDAIDGADGKTLNEHINKLTKVFNRGGFTAGYFLGDGNKTDVIADQTADEAFLKEARNTYETEKQKLPLEMRLMLKQNEPSRLYCSSVAGEVEVFGRATEKANLPQKAERYIEQLRKLGGTQFFADNITVNMDDFDFLPLSAVNELRREAIVKLNELAKKRNELSSVTPDILDKKTSADIKTLLSVKVRNIAAAEIAVECGADEIIIEPVEYRLNELSEYRNRLNSIPIYLSLPYMLLHESDIALIKEIVNAEIFDGYEINNLGHLGIIEGANRIIAGTGMNVANKHTVKKLLDMGISDITLSIELTKAQLNDIINCFDVDIIVYGKAQLMQLAHCSLKEHYGCKNCSGNVCSIKDEKERSFALVNTRLYSGCVLKMLNCYPTNTIDLMSALPPLKRIILEFLDAEAEEIREITTSARRAADGLRTEKPREITRGHWNRPLE